MAGRIVAALHLHEAKFPLWKGCCAVRALAALPSDVNLYKGLILTRRKQDRAKHIMEHSN